MTTRKGTTPEWLVERLALGELDDAAAADVRARLAAEGRDVDAERARLAASSREILGAHPPARVAATVRARAMDGRRGARRWLVGAPLALAGAAALVLVARPAPRAPVAPTTEAPEHIAIKGDANARVVVYRRAGEVSERLRDGTRAANGDLLQLAYLAGDASFGALLSIDGRGHVTAHWPEPGAAIAAPLSARGEVRLPSAYELDDAPAFERFFLVTADAPFPMTAVMNAARALAARPAAARADGLALPPSLHQASLTLEKTRKETP
ncbi:MAG TPA: hypothetical protein VLA14_12220 [Polyangia bacterium]|jgi:hypothetical protein|nr:hypothetical protein [Polyangia bacterium]